MTAIKPKEIRVNVRKILKAKDGNVLDKMTKGDGQAQKLENSIKGSFGQEVQEQTLKNKCLLNIREDDKIIIGIMKASYL